jgi:hypothetical protein
VEQEGVEVKAESKGRAEESGEGSMERHLKEKLKEDHRKGLNRLKSSLQSTRAMEIGSFQQNSQSPSQVRPPPCLSVCFSDRGDGCGCDLIV